MFFWQNWKIFLSCDIETGQQTSELESPARSKDSRQSRFCSTLLEGLFASAPPSTAMHITTNRLHPAASANFVSVLQSNEAEFQRAAAVAFFTADFSLSLSLSLRLRRSRCVRRTMAAHFADCSLCFAVSVRPPSLSPRISIRVPPSIANEVC